MRKADVVVIGAGTAGAGAAWQCARRGMKVLCVDGRPLDECGARWVNGVAPWQLEVAGVPPSPASEVLGGAAPFHLVAGYGPERVLIEDHGVIDLDMRALVRRLQGLALDENAEVRGDVRVTSFDGVRLETTAGVVEAGVIVDASGLGGAGLMTTPRISREHLCAAAQGVHAVTDLNAARAFFERHGVREGEVLCFSGTDGGYSILNLRLHGNELGILTGSIPALGHASGRAILERFVAQHAWVGPQHFGGSRAIPLRRPFERLASERTALVGDAASQVFSAHGSGIALGLVAGRVLADALASGGGLSAYEREFQRTWGGLLAAYDLFRRFSQTLTAADIASLMRAGLLDGATSAAAMAQRWPAPDVSAARHKLVAASKSPRLAAKLAGVLARMGSVAALYKAYPSSRGRRFRAWSRAVAAVFDEELTRNDDVTTARLRSP